MRQNIATLLSALEVFEKEEELMADANEEMLNSVENLKRLNTALANSAEDKEQRMLLK